MNVQFQYVPVDKGLRLHVAMAGPADGPLVMLLHGFPEFWYAWRQQMTHLAQHGYRVWAPDQRGYNLSDKPREVTAYNIEALANDIVRLIDAAGREKAAVIGHDWGGAVAWWLARRFPERVERLISLNQAHGSVFLKAVRQDADQRRKSMYMLFFQLPWLPEKTLSFRNYAILLRSLRKSARPGVWEGEALDAYRQAWSRPGAMTGMLNWYRAIRKARPAVQAASRVTMPSLIVWGKDDTFLSWRMAEPSLAYCDTGRVVYLDEASHWLHHERPERVNELLIEGLADKAGAGTSGTTPE